MHEFKNFRLIIISGLYQLQYLQKHSRKNMHFFFKKHRIKIKKQKSVMNNNKK